LSARKIAQQIDLSYPTVVKTVTLIRKAIVANSVDAADLLSGEVELNEAYFGGRRKDKCWPWRFEQSPGIWHFRA
jgi:hypothetical protein